MGHYQFLREIAKGPFGPLYELSAEAGTSGLGGLGRLVPFPGDLSPEVEQAIAEAAWDSMELRHEFVLCVADVVFGKGWVMLIHDYAEGSLLRSLQRRAKERQSAFPVSIALRVVLDMLDGLDRNCSVCESAGIPWNPGGAGATSLYLCGDGRTRSLDGQLMATLNRARQMRDHVSVIEFLAPELVDPDKQPDERADVFAAGAVLWELLTSRELTLESSVVQGQRSRPRLPSVSLSVPKGTQIPPDVAQAINAALELDPTKRIATRSALRSALTQGVEVATYEKVIDFIDALLHRESTLFRLTLNPGPRLSDKLRSERPKPQRLERDVQLAKRARSAQPPPKPSLPTARIAEAPAANKALANRTLVGINPAPSLGSLPRTPVAIDAKPTEVEPKAEIAKVVEPIPVPVLEAPPPEDTSDTDQTVLKFYLDPTFAAEVRQDSPDLVPAFAPEVHRDTPDLVPAFAPEARPDTPAEPAAALREALDFGKLPKSADRYVYQLSLPMLVIGLVVTVTIAVVATIMIQRSFSKNSPASSVSATVTAPPPLAAVPILTPAPLLAPTSSVEETVTSPPPSAAASSESPSAAQASPNLKPLAPRSDKATTTDSRAAPKNVVRKRRQQYVPNQL